MERLDPVARTIATEWIIVLLRLAGLVLFVAIGWQNLPRAAVDMNTLHLFVLIGLLYNFYTAYLLYSGGFVRDIPRFLSFFLTCDILLLVALAYFSTLFQSGLLDFYLFLIIIVAFRASLRNSLILGPILVLAYFFTSMILSGSEGFSLRRFATDSISLVATSIFCGWLSEGNSRAWAAVDRVSRRLRVVSRDLAETSRQLDLYRRLQEMQREFISVMSHELRTPLTGIMGYNDLLLLGEAGPLSERQKNFLTEMMTKSTELLGLINNILDISKIQQGRWDLNLEPLHPQRLVDEALNTLMPEALKKGLEIIHSSGEAEATPLINADREKVVRALLNLIGNAVKFTPPGGQVRISEETCTDSALEARYRHLIASTQAVCFTITDTGPGIQEEDRPHIFEMFYRGSVPGDIRPGGAGLGLAMAKEIAEFHWGDIRFEEAPGGGSTFRLRLPVNPLRLRRKIALVKTRFDIITLLEGLIQEFAKEIRLKNLTVVRRWHSKDAKSLDIVADRQLLQGVLFNVLSNKIRYAFPESELQVSVRHNTRLRQVVIRIANQGEVLMGDFLEGAAETGPHGATPAEKDLRHINVNLTLARDIIESHGGTYTIENVNDNGVATTITLNAGEMNEVKGDPHEEDSDCRG